MHTSLSLYIHICVDPELIRTWELRKRVHIYIGIYIGIYILEEVLRQVARKECTFAVIGVGPGPTRTWERVYI